MQKIFFVHEGLQKKKNGEKFKMAYIKCILVEVYNENKN